MYWLIGIGVVAVLAFAWWAIGGYADYVSSLPDDEYEEL